MDVSVKRAVERIEAVPVLERSLHDTQILPGHVTMAFGKVREVDIERHRTEIDFDPRIATDRRAEGIRMGVVRANAPGPHCGATDRITASRSAFDAQGV